MQNIALTPPAPLWRRLAVALYDGMLVLAIWMSAAVLATPVLAYLDIPSRTPIQILAVLGAWLYFARSWTRGGQTLGMRAWKLRLRRFGEDAPLSLTAASARYFAMLLLCIVPVVLGGAALLGIDAQFSGLRWLLVLPVATMLPATFGSRRALHDRLCWSETVLVAADPARRNDG